MRAHQLPIRLPTLQAVKIDGDSYDQMKTTLQVVGSAIVNGSRYLPIRNRAAALASLAAPKDYLGQAASIYNDFVKRWKYVKDPVGRELVTHSPQAVFELVMGGKSKAPGAGFGYGVGDCDCATVAVGSQLMAIGLPVRLAVIAPKGAPPGRLMSHIFPQALIPAFGWVTVDPVVYPKHGFAYTPPYSRIAFFDLQGEILGKKGNAVNMHGLGKMEDREMNNIPNIDQWQDYAGLGDYVEENESLPDFRGVISGFGCYAEQRGIMDMGGTGLGFGAEVETDARGLAWAPIMELAPKDYDFISATGSPYHGMLAMSDEATPYFWDQGLGLFKKLFRKAKRAVKKVAGKIKKGVRKVARKAKKIAKKVISKLPGGKYLLKLGKKLWKISKKLVGPLLKKLGPIALKIAPIVAFVPGIGTAAAAALATTGKIAQLMKKYKVNVVQKAGKIGKVKFKSGKQAKAFQKALKKEAKRTKSALKKGKRPGRVGPGKMRARRPMPGRRMAARRPMPGRRIIAARRRMPKRMIARARPMMRRR